MAFSRVKTALSEAELIAQRPEVFRRLLSLGAAGIGLGATGRTLLDLFSTQPEYKMPFVSPGPSTLEIPVSPQEEEQPQTGLAKLTRGLKRAGWAEDLSKKFPSIVDKIPLFGPTLNSIERGVNHAGQAWWNGPAAVGIGAGSVGLGWGLADWLVGKNRKQQTDDELNHAKDVYQQALLSEGTKQAGKIDPIVAKLDTVFDLFEKVAAEKSAAEYGDWWNPIAQGFSHPAGNAAVGAYITALGTLAAGTGYAGYQWAKSRSPSSLLQKALQARAQRLWQTTSQPIEAVPQSMKQEESATAA